MEKEQKIIGKPSEKRRKILRFIRIPTPRKPYLTPTLVALGNISKLTFSASVFV